MQMSTEGGGASHVAAEPTVFRAGGISYLELPSTDLAESVAFYRAAFASWSIRDSDPPAFTDGTGHVIGHWRTDRPVVGDAGVVPYVYVDSVRAVGQRITANGGSMVTEPYPEGDLLVATFRDPSGNVLGIWQRGHD